MQESVLMLSALLTTVQSYDDERLSKLVYDAYRFTLNHRSIIEQAPLQTYYSALMFSPSRSVTREVYKSELPRWITCVSATTDVWGLLTQTLEGEGPVQAVRFSPGGEELMSLSRDLTVRTWDVRTGTLLHTLQDKDLSKQGSDIGPPRFSFNGQKIAFIWLNTIEIWDMIFESRMQTIERNDIILVALSPTEQKLASGSVGGTVRVWDVTSGMLLQTYEDCAGCITSLEFSPNGQKLASKFGHQNWIHVWDLGSASLLHAFRGLSEQFEFELGVGTALAFSRSGKTIACGVDARTIKIWHAETGAALQTIRSRVDVAGVAILSNEEHLAGWTNMGGFRVWNVLTGLLLRKFDLEIRGIFNEFEFSPIVQRLASGDEDGSVRVWDTAFKPPISPMSLGGHSGSVSMLVFSPNGQKLASLCQWIVPAVILWDVATGSPGEIYYFSNATTSVVFSIDGVKLVSMKKGKHILDIMNTDTGELLEREDCSLSDLHATTANPSHGLSLIDRWITVNGKRLIRLPPDRHGSAFATSGTKLAIGAFTGVVTFLDLDLQLGESSIPWLHNAEGQVILPGDVHDSDSASEEDDEFSDIEDSEMEVPELKEPDIEDSETQIGAIRRERR